MSQDYFSTNIKYIKNTKERQVHFKIESLNDIHIQSLQKEAENLSQNKQIIISFKKTSISIEQKLIKILADILKKEIQYDQIHIKNRYSNGSQQNLLTLIQELNSQNILRLSLDMKKNNLNYEEAERLVGEISRFTNLQKLYLVFSQHTSQSCYFDCINKILQNIKIQKLVLSLEKNPISPTNFEELVNKISEINQLKSLKLKINGNLLTRQQSHILNKISSKIQNLEKLSLIIDLSFLENQKNKDQMELEEDIIQNLNVRKLFYHETFNKNLAQIPNQSLKFGFKLLNSYPNLRKLNLNLENLTESDQLEYSYLISKQNQLEELKVFFSNSQLSVKLAEEFQKGISNLIFLEKLHIECVLENNYSQFHLPKILESLVQIKELKLCINPFGFSESSQKQLYDSLNLMKNLQNLHLQVPFDIYRTFPVKYFVKTISKCMNLKNLKINSKEEIKGNKQKIKVRFTNPQNKFHHCKYRQVQSLFTSLQLSMFKQSLANSKFLLKTPKLVSYQIF